MACDRELACFEETLINGIRRRITMLIPRIPTLFHRRSVNFVWHRKGEMLSPIFWSTVWRVVKERFNFWEKVSEKRFKSNLDVIETRPWNLHIELSNQCNANCIFCAYQYQTRPKEFMSEAVYQKSLDDYCSIGGGDLMLEVTVGDPGLDKKLIDRIKDARSRPEIASIETITNAIAFDHKRIIDLIHSGISKIQISTGPLDKELYEKIFRNKMYPKVLRNITTLLVENKNAGCPVEVKLAFRTNLTMAKTLLLPDYKTIKNLPHNVEFNTDWDSWTGEIKQEDLLKGMHLRPLTLLEKEPCIWLYDGPIIYSNGNVGVCGCRDFNANSELVVGNIMEKSLIDIWRSDAVRMLRSKFTSGEFPSICRKCTTYANLNYYRTAKGSDRARLTSERLAKKGDYEGACHI